MCHARTKWRARSGRTGIFNFVIFTDNSNKVCSGIRYKHGPASFFPILLLYYWLTANRKNSRGLHAFNIPAAARCHNSIGSTPRIRGLRHAISTRLIVSCDETSRRLEREKMTGRADNSNIIICSISFPPAKTSARSGANIGPPRPYLLFTIGERRRVARGIFSICSQIPPRAPKVTLQRRRLSFVG